MFFSEKIRSLYLKNNSRWSLMTTLPKTEKNTMKLLNQFHLKKNLHFLKERFVERKNTQHRRIQNSVENLRWNFFVKTVND